MFFRPRYRAGSSHYCSIRQQSGPSTWVSKQFNKTRRSWKQMNKIDVHWQGTWEIETERLLNVEKLNKQNSARFQGSLWLWFKECLSHYLSKMRQNRGEFMITGGLNQHDSWIWTQVWWEQMDKVTYLSPQPAKWWHLEFRLLLPPSDWALQSLK